jgi:hypothetical protein
MSQWYAMNYKYWLLKLNWKEEETDTWGKFLTVGAKLNETAQYCACVVLRI